MNAFQKEIIAGIPKILPKINKVDNSVSHAPLEKIYFLLKKKNWL